MRLSDEVLSVECDDLDLRHGPTRLLAACLYWRRRALAAERQREVIVNNEPNEQEESAQSIPLGAPAELPPFDDPRVQLVYGLLCDTDSHPPPEQHWEGWLARRIVAALKATDAPAEKPPSAPDALDAARYRSRLEAMLPLFEEARDALPAISLASAKLHGVDLSLAARMDAVGDPAKWATHPANPDAAMAERREI
jgi:hypothetical protein